jgi:hypothetical protein
MYSCAYPVLAPRTVVQPRVLVGETTAPAVIGPYVFAERDALDRRERRYSTVGNAGGLSVALSFSGVV